MLNFFKEYFIFSRGERNGIIVLLLIIILLIVVPYLYGTFRHKAKVDFSEFNKEIEAFERQQALAQENRNITSQSFELFNFDPNEISEDEWKKLGVQDRTVRIILNYRNKGGVFWDKEDLLKIYGFDSAKYEMLEPYIMIAEEDESSREKFAMDPFDKPVYKKWEKQKPDEKLQYERKPQFKPKENIIVELNTADSLTLVKVNGIGPVLSKRIIKYRNLLGGFVSVNQLMEVYGMDSTWFEKIMHSLTVDSNQISRIAINNVSWVDLQRHPYVGKNVANAILNYRQQHGAFTGVDDLKKIYLINEELFQKLRPYIVIEQVDG